jgi:putative dehydrogenase
LLPRKIVGAIGISSGKPDMEKSIGIVGLGIMGGVFARHLAEAGWHVVGHDIDAARRDESVRNGVEIVGDAAAVAAKAKAILTVLPSAAALHAVVQDIVTSGAAERIVVEMGTLSLADKFQAQRALADAGHAMLDCPVSGTGAQAKNKDLVLFVSGDREIGKKLEPAFGAFCREAHYVGPFGNGTRMKFVTNHLVAVHCAAAGEAMA